MSAPDRWSRIEMLYHAARELVGGKRAAFLDAACRGDAELRREVESLLAQPASADAFLDEPAAALAAQLITNPDARYRTGEISSAPASMIGTTLSHYRVVGKLGVGGMGVVYDAEDTRLSRRVALKFLPQELATDLEAARRLQREAETLALLNHPNICTVHEIGEYDGGRFIAMERIEGVNLKVHMVQKPLVDAEIVHIAREVADALYAAHTAGVVHRDIKPGNIMIGGFGQVKVLDFGLARRFKFPDTGEVLTFGSTIPGRPLGTANYMAPERILQGPLDPRSDLFSLGVVIYEMATGTLPFAGASPYETVTNVLEKDPIPLTELAPQRPRRLEPIVRHLLEKCAGERYQSADAVAGDLKRLTRLKGGSVSSFLRHLRRITPTPQNR